MTEIPSSSEYLQMKKWKLMNSIHIHNQSEGCDLFNPPVLSHKEETCKVGHEKIKKMFDIQKEIFSNKFILLLNRYSEKFVAGKYNELAIILTIKKVNKLVKHINRIVPENKKIKRHDRPICLKIINTYLANLNIIVNYLHLNALFQNTNAHLISLEKAFAEIRGNKSKLLQYLKEMSAPSIMPLAITAPLLHIRHEYNVYHKRYGVPENLNYDLGKLKKILEHD